MHNDAIDGGHVSLPIGCGKVLRRPKTTALGQWRHVQHNQSVQSLDVGDVNGHSLYLYQLPGIAFFPDGSTGATMVIGTSDLTNGSGTNSGYAILTLSDGSALFMKYSGTNHVEGTISLRGGAPLR